MKKALVLAAIALGPVAAGAQVPQPIRSAGAETADQHGITVNGWAQVRVAASSARITVTISSTDTKSTITEHMIQPVTDALLKAGAERSSIQLLLPFSVEDATVAALSGEIKSPTLETMRSGIAMVGAAIAGSHAIRLNSMKVKVRNDDCLAAQETARADAIDAAHAKAALIAKQIHVSLGRVMNIDAYDRDTPDRACESQYSIGQWGPLFTYGGDTLEDYAVVPVNSDVKVTYAIK